MTNTNCLAGFKCPQCAATDQFDISTEQVSRWRDDGLIDTHGDSEWTPRSFCRCTNCDYASTVAEFTGVKAPERQIIVTVEGGLCSAVVTHCAELLGISVLIVDYDMPDGAEPDELGTLVCEDGTELTAIVRRDTITRSAITLKPSEDKPA